VVHLFVTFALLRSANPRLVSIFFFKFSKAIPPTPTSATKLINLRSSFNILFTGDYPLCNSIATTYHRDARCSSPKNLRAVALFLLRI
jgi:hypothetical protein